MKVSDLVSLFATLTPYRTTTALLQRTGGTKPRIALSHAPGSSPALLVGTMADQVQRGTIVCVAEDADRAGYLHNDLMTLLGYTPTGDGAAESEEEVEEIVAFLPSLYRRGIRYGQLDEANEFVRTQVIDRLRYGTPPRIIVTYPDALMERVTRPESDSRITLRAGDEVERKELREQLWSMGYEECDYVYRPGHFAVRGSLIDIYSYGHDLPVRIDFFGDEVERLHTFDPKSQLSRGDMDQVVLVPRLSVEDDAGSSLVTLLPDESLFFIEEMGLLKTKCQSIYSAPPVHPEDNRFGTLEQMQSMLTRPDQLLDALHGYPIIATGLGIEKRSDSREEWHVIDLGVQSEPLFHKRFDLLADSLTTYQQQGYTTAIMSSQPSQLRRLSTIFAESGRQVSFVPLSPSLSAGFVIPEARLALFTDHTIFERFHNYELKSDRIRKNGSVLTLKEVRSFEIGDYVVHINHGIGTFGGLFTMEMNGKTKEMVRLNYKGGGSIYVSIHSLHHISKYKSKDSDEPPQLSKLGSGAWDKIKERTKKKVKDIARDLIQLYAQRMRIRGFAFSPDTYLQHELEASFKYEDTPDQERATADVKSDMERPVPMDRLVCGDVGFGKTEVAIRAAFKAVADSKQVAVMVPTTVLAYQHYRTFSRRLEAFPCRVEYLSQSKTTKERNQILKDLKEGRIDIIIGTHTLAGKMVEYHDLGLVIIDEEQKFGVAVKERLRAYRAHVDTLTLTATPIPRTLQFSLMGARDLSNIQTPPPNRQPITTDHGTYSIELIAEVVNAELARDGQVFFIHNRIHNIESIADDIRSAVPGIRIGIGHGQMPPKELETVLLDFVHHKYDLLLATSIVENGIDVPNANTIIINDAQRFGLSDLHQLRGRVGRGSAKAYCVLLTPPADLLTADARRRLRSITDFAELGSGINIAMQDLDIRGAGNLLGSEQSGFIADLGYETYKRILEEAVHELKDTEFTELFDSAEESTETATDVGTRPTTGRKQYVYETNLETDVEAYLPQTYVPGDDERINLYRELDAIQRPAELSAYRTRLMDRFGPLPAEADELLRVVQLRQLGVRCGIEKIILKNGLLKLYLVSDFKSGYYRSKVFATILANATAWGRDLTFKEEEGKRSISIRGVGSISDALLKIEKLSELSVV